MFAKEAKLEHLYHNRLGREGKMCTQRVSLLLEEKGERAKLLSILIETKPGVKQSE